MSRMFSVDGKPMRTWNIHVGCDFGCTYCSARKLALTRLRNCPRYQHGFNPHIVEEELDRVFHPGEWVFVGYMGELSFARRDEVNIILSHIKYYKDTIFLFCSKNPACYAEWGLHYPDNLYLGATIETNRDYGLSKAPPPAERYRAMAAQDHPHKFISIEPLLDFHLRTLLDWMKEIGPEIIEIGADNYHNNLPEPIIRERWKVQWLVDMLREFCPQVVEKEGLGRLKMKIAKGGEV